MHTYPAITLLQLSTSYPNGCLTCETHSIRNINLVRPPLRVLSRIENFKKNFLRLPLEQTQGMMQTLTAKPNMQATRTAYFIPFRHRVVTSLSSKSWSPIENATIIDRQHNCGKEHNRYESPAKVCCSFDTKSDIRCYISAHDGMQ